MSGKDEEEEGGVQVMLECIVCGWWLGWSELCAWETVKADGDRKAP